MTKTLTNIRLSVVLLCLFAAPWAIPALLAQALPAATHNVTAATPIRVHTDALDAQIVPPLGWQQHNTGESTSTTFTHEQATINVTLFEGATDLDTSATRLSSVLSRDGQALYLQPETTTVADGHPARTCTIIDGRANTTGHCIITFAHNTLVLLSEVSPEPDPVPEFAPLVQSLQLQEKEQ